jgi:hypothetical protein
MYISIGYIKRYASLWIGTLEQEKKNGGGWGPILGRFVVKT